MNCNEEFVNISRLLPASYFKRIKTKELLAHKSIFFTMQIADDGSLPMFLINGK